MKREYLILYGGRQYSVLADNAKDALKQFVIRYWFHGVNFVFSGWKTVSVNVAATGEIVQLSLEHEKTSISHGMYTMKYQWELPA